ncbi:hypothetical protein [Nostoc sp. CHAB 5715]|uniref:hypothetical protein n=1 Tax=Nostoc sp. CHAB 5715 TaxID=2780400 RepID=UPI001E5C8969|nr:hypothetical protein [Nostoc sp. CHAB 5715]MCC5620386.1 hypothetical protein [Nostoc sp. CHAB 5715]
MGKKFPMPNALDRRGAPYAIGVNLSPNTQFSVVLDPSTPLTRGHSILIPPNLSGG